jgi:DNA-binding response OmpR family regulator
MGLKLAERRPPSVLIVDAKLGGFGYLTERLRRISPHIHLVLLVAPDDPVEAASARLGGAGSMLRKPLDTVRFRSTLRTVLRLSAMSAGVKRMRGAHDEHAVPAPLPRVK